MNRTRAFEDCILVINPQALSRLTVPDFDSFMASCQTEDQPCHFAGLRGSQHCHMRGFTNPNPSPRISPRPVTKDDHLSPKATHRITAEPELKPRLRAWQILVACKPSKVPPSPTPHQTDDLSLGPGCSPLKGVFEFCLEILTFLRHGSASLGNHWVSWGILEMFKRACKGFSNRIKQWPYFT